MADPTDDIIANIADKLASLGGDAFAVLTVPAKDVGPAAAEACRLLAPRGPGVYVSLSKDYLSVSIALMASGVDLSHMKFVDAVSRMYGIAPVDAPEVTYIDGPLSVDQIIQGISEALRGVEKGGRFVIFDSLTTLLLYNSLSTTLAFTQSLRDLLRREHTAGLVVVAYVDDLNKDLIDKLKAGGGEIVEA